jgi:hypothetical protein
MRTSKKLDHVTVAIVAIALVIASVCIWWFQFEQPHRQALNAFSAAAAQVNAKNATLDHAIKSLDNIASSPRKPLNPKTRDDATTLIVKAKAEKRNVPESPDTTDDLKIATEKLKAPLDYSTIIASLSAQRTKLEDSIKQLEQVTDPTGDFVVKRITGLPTITAIAAATEKNDPNGQLNKSHGYTAAIFFASSNVDKNKLPSSDLIENGTDAGGQIEVYRTVADAKKRNEYLEAFDGTAFSAGSHTVVGTCVIRVSDEMNAAQQKNVTDEVAAALTALR